MKPIDTQTIQELKTWIASVPSLSEEELALLSQDPRAGVQALVASAQRQKKKEEMLEQEHDFLLRYERELWASGKTALAGLDEVGRGPLAGPVVAAAVILPSDIHLPGLTDSKKLSEAKRNEFYEKIKDSALSYGIGQAEASEIDALNIYQATKLAMTRAVAQLGIQPDFLLVDAMTLSLPVAQQSLIKGDANSLSIAAASVLAKVTRDRLMRRYHTQYPEYKFNSNAGYGTKDHLEALKRYGACPIHRTSFSPVKATH